WRLVTVYGPDRFPGITGMKGRDDLPWSTWGLFALPALPCILVTGFGTHQLSSARIVLGIVVGILLATAVLWITARIHFFIERESGRSALTVFPGLGFLRPQPDNSRSAAARLLDRMLASIIPHPLVGGLMKPDPDDPTRLRLRSGHQLAGTVVAVLLFIYVVIGICFSPAFALGRRPPAAMFYLLYLIVLFTWLFSGLAFFLDAVRIPVLSSALAISFLCGIAATDHHYSITLDPAHRVVPDPRVVVHAWKSGSGRGASNPNKPVVVVATAGGGIRAAAWTAEVLT